MGGYVSPCSGGTYASTGPPRSECSCLKSFGIRKSVRATGLAAMGLTPAGEMLCPKKSPLVTPSRALDGGSLRLYLRRRSNSSRMVPTCSARPMRDQTGGKELVQLVHEDDARTCTRRWLTRLTLTNDIDNVHGDTQQRCRSGAQQISWTKSAVPAMGTVCRPVVNNLEVEYIHRAEGSRPGSGE